MKLLAKNEYTLYKCALHYDWDLPGSLQKNYKGVSDDYLQLASGEPSLNNLCDKIKLLDLITS